MRLATFLTAAVGLAAVASPASAEPRWLACKVTDQGGQVRNFSVVFDDRRNTVGVWDGTSLAEGTSVVTTFQALRATFPNFSMTYNRNDGAFSMTPLGANYGGLLHGECRRSLPPPGAPAGQR
ncbi:hypothetical protein [Reyranella sp.]|uniref:hypothetical protein n=1 Tax=Reyranella sp. TaxID=1929291 RepID=UPI0040360501